MKSLRFDQRAAKRLNLARDQLLGMSDHQLSTLTSERLQRSFGLLPVEADQLLKAIRR